MRPLWTPLLNVITKTVTFRQASQQQRLRLQNAKHTTTSSKVSAFNLWQLKPLVCMAGAPFLSCLARKLVDMSGDPREWQLFHQGLPLAVLRWNAASILACAQVWSDCSYSQRTKQYYCPPLASVSMHSYCSPNVHVLCKFCYPLAQCYFAQLLTILTTAWHMMKIQCCNVFPLSLKLLRFFYSTVGAGHCFYQTSLSASKKFLKTLKSHFSWPKAVLLNLW